MGLRTGVLILMGNYRKMVIKRTSYFSFPDGKIYDLLDELFNKCKAEIESRQKTKTELDALNRGCPVFGKMKKLFITKAKEIQK